MPALMQRLRGAVLPLGEPPRAPAWNHATMTAWLGPLPRPLVPSAVLVGVRDDTDHEIIFTRRHDHLAKHAGQVAFPGGGVEVGDRDPVDTALREAEEEVGLPRRFVTPLGYLPCFETNSGFLVTPVVASIAADAPCLKANAGEVAEVFDAPLTFFMDASNVKRYMMELHGDQRPMSEFRYGGQRIWGATAAMLLNLLQRMGEPWVQQSL